MLQKACLAVPSRSADSTSQRIEEEGKKNMWKVPAVTRNNENSENHQNLSVIWMGDSETCYQLLC